MRTVSTLRWSKIMRQGCWIISYKSNISMIVDACLDYVSYHTSLNYPVTATKRCCHNLAVLLRVNMFVNSKFVFFKYMKYMEKSNLTEQLIILINWLQSTDITYRTLHNIKELAIRRENRNGYADHMQNTKGITLPAYMHYYIFHKMKIY